MPKITFIGGGSAKFVAALVRDLFTFEKLRASEICLMDIAPDRLDRSRRLVEKIIADLKLPAAMTPHILCHEMAVQGVLNHDRRLIRQAIQADPMTGAVLTLPKINAMVDELFEANRDYLQDWK